MGSLENVAQILSIFSGMAISITAILALLSKICSPIRSMVAKMLGIGNKNKEIIDKIEDVKTSLTNRVDMVENTLSNKVQEVSDANDKNEIKRLRWEILDFANSCKNGRRHTQDEYKHIIEAHDDYESLLEKTGDKNGFLDAEFDYIMRLYADRQEKNDFL